jgi:hypothetical protein
MKVSLNIEVQFPKGFPNRTKVQATSKGKQELVVKVPGMVANLPTNSKVIFKPFREIYSYKTRSLVCNGFN